MLWNVLLDTLLGAIPGVGDVFDAYFKANVRNLKLLREHAEKADQAATPPRKADLWIVFGGIALVVVGAIVPIVIVYWGFASVRSLLTR